MCLSGTSAPLKACSYAFNDLPSLAQQQGISTNDNQENPIVTAPLNKQDDATLSLSNGTLQGTTVLSALTGTDHVSQIISIYAALLEDTLCPFSLIIDASRPEVCNTINRRLQDKYSCSPKRCKSCHDLMSSMYYRLKLHYETTPMVVDLKLPDLDRTDDDDDFSCTSYDSMEQSSGPPFVAPQTISTYTSPTFAESLSSSREEITTTTKFSTVRKSERCPGRSRQS